jgi:uncharacterized membrane protein YeaQ/YmgE (transglycosylase-associated protein family)
VFLLIFAGIIGGLLAYTLLDSWAGTDPAVKTTQ